MRKLISESELKQLMETAVGEVLKEIDRHKDGYYQEYAEKTGKKDRHKPGYYAAYRERKKAEQNAQPTEFPSIEQPQTLAAPKNKPKKRRDRRDYYRKYNQEHPERLQRGYGKGGKPIQYIGLDRILGYDEFGFPITTNPFGDMIRFHEATSWHDDDWCESFEGED